MRKILLLLFFLIKINILLNAQISFGPVIGINLAKSNYDYKNQDEPDIKCRFAQTIGFLLMYDFNNHFAIQTGLEYNGKGFSSDLKSDIEKTNIDGFSRTRINYFEFPLNFICKIKLKDNMILLNLGAYCAMAFDGKVNNDFSYTNNDGEDVRFYDDFNMEFTDNVSSDADLNFNVYYKRFDYGLNFGLGYLYKSYLFKIGYSRGLNNITPDYASLPNKPSSDYKEYNSTLNLSFSYFFGRKKND